MTTERAPLLPQGPTLGRALDTQSSAGETDDETDAPTPRPLGLRTVSAARRDRFYEENEELKRCNVFQSVHRVYRLIQGYVDIPISEEQLRNPELQFHVVLPLEEHLVALGEPSVVYVLLLVRLQFVRESTAALSSHSLNQSRAALCEVLAVKLLRHQASTVTGSAQGMLAMARALVGGFHAFQGASEEVLDRIRQKEGYASRVGALSGAGKTNALELAILGKARSFIKSQTTQRVIGLLFDGKITYSSSSFLDILPDRWKSKEIALYNVREAPLLDHYRLRVPKYRSMIEFASFLVLFVSFILVIVDRHTRYEHIPVSTISWMEVWFFVYSLGYSLDRLASVAEHGWSVYAAGLTNGLDAASVPIYISAFVLRAHSVITGDAHASDRAYAILSCAACLLFPRLAFTTISNNLLILSLRAMIADFVYLLGITVFCFVGFVFALNHLSEGAYSVARISEWLVFIFFGLDGSGIDESPKFDPVLGPILFLSFAALSNTLLTSILVAILSTTYANVAADAAAEDMFRKAVNTFEGVKSGSLFDYVPPFNLIALMVLWPLSHFLSPRWFHKVNVLTTRTLSLPILLIIALYERQLAPETVVSGWAARTRLWITDRLPTVWAQKVSLLEGAHWECEAVFEYTASGDEKDSSEDELDDRTIFGGPDELDEELRAENTGSPRPIATRASVFLDPVRVAAAQRKSQAQDSENGGTPSSASSVLSATSAGTARASPIPLSRQPSFAHDAEAHSTIRVNKTAATRPPLPHSPSAPIPVTQTSSSKSPAPASPDNSPLQRFPNSDDSFSTAVFTDSPPSSPHRQRYLSDAPPTTRFAPLPSSREGLSSSLGKSSNLRRSQTLSSSVSNSERLPANAAFNSHRRRRSSIDEGAISGIAWPELSASAPTKDSPLARLYSQPVAGIDEDGLGITKAGAVRRRMSMGPAAGHARFGSDGGAGLLSSSTRSRRGGGGGEGEPSAAELMEMIKGLVSTVGRLEKKLDDERKERRRTGEEDE